MFETVVVATDGSDSARRGVHTALDIAARFDATVHALYVVDTATAVDSPDPAHGRPESAGQTALGAVREEAVEYGCELVTAVEEGSPATEIVEYAERVDADLVATGTRGRHGEHAHLLGSVAEAVVRRSPVPVLTVRQLEAATEA